MGLLGRYLDSLPSDARDRIIRAQDWEFRPPDDRHNPWGLIGHAEGMAYPEPRGASYARQLELQFVRLLFFGYRSGSRIGGRFYRLCRRFGLDRTVRLIKRRAANPFMVQGSLKRH